MAGFIGHTGKVYPTTKIKPTFTGDYSVLLGNLLEFYDFTLFSALLPIIAPLLFPSQSILTAFTSSYIFLAIGFLARPLGAVIFGYIGDRYNRKTSLILAISMMSGATFGIGLLPPYELVGGYSLFILAICRFLQGLSAGGEYSGAGLLLTEDIKSGDNAFKGALLTAFGLLGAFFASILAVVVSLNIFPQFSWRLLFLTGGCLGFFILWLRFSAYNEHSKIENPNYKLKDFSWGFLFQEHKVSLLCTIGVGALMNVPFYLVTGFINTYFIALEVYTKTTLMLINAAVILFCCIITGYFGSLLRHFNPARVMMCASLAIATFAFPFFLLVNSGTLVYFVIAELVLIILSQLFVAPAVVIMIKMFPYTVRYRGVAIGNCLGLALLGGSTPYISGYLIKHTGLLWAPAFYLFGVALLGFISILTAEQKLNHQLCVVG